MSFYQKKIKVLEGRIGALTAANKAIAAESEAKSEKIRVLASENATLRGVTEAARRSQVSAEERAGRADENTKSIAVKYRELFQEHFHVDF